MGAQASGGMDALLGRTTLAGLAAHDDDDELQSRRLELRFGYGFSAFSDRFASVPEIGIGLSDGTRDYSLGWRLAVGDSRSRGAARTPSSSASRRRGASANDNAGAEHGIGLRHRLAADGAVVTGRFRGGHRAGAESAVPTSRAVSFRAGKALPGGGEPRAGRGHGHMVGRGRPKGRLRVRLDRPATEAAMSRHRRRWGCGF